MGKLEPFENHRTNWMGLWYHADTHKYSSATLNLADLRKFKGNFKMLVCKNRNYVDGGNRPNYVFCLCDSNYDTVNPKGFEVQEIQIDCETEYQTSDGERLYTRDEVMRCINGAIRDARNGYDVGDVIVEDYI